MFGNQGDLWRTAQTWFDHETGSVWSQVTGTALLGPLAGTTIELLPSELANWSDWREQFPETQALATGTARNTFRVRNLTVAGRVNDEVAGVEFRDLAPLGSISTEIDGEPVIFIAEEEEERWAVFFRTVDGVERNIELQLGLLVDTDTGDTWSPRTGASFTGAGQLDRVPTFSANFANFIDIFPDAQVLVEPAVIRDIPFPVLPYTVLRD